MFGRGVWLVRRNSLSGSSAHILHWSPFKEPAVSIHVVSKMSADLDVEEDHYATAANFGGDAQDSEKAPFVTKVTVPESIKRRVPSKHYVRII